MECNLINTEIIHALQAFADMLTFSSLQVIKVCQNCNLKLKGKLPDVSLHDETLSCIGTLFERNEDGQDYKNDYINSLQNITNDTNILHTDDRICLIDKPVIVKNLYKTKQFINIMILNAQSCRTITIELHDLLIDKDLDILILTETWLYETGDEVLIKEMTPPGYKFFSFPRNNGQSGGGIGFMVKEDLCKNLLFFKLPYTTFEAVEARIFCLSTSFSIICVYRPPSSKKNHASIKTFRDEFHNLLEAFNNVRRDVLFTGDFNIHFDTHTDPNVQKVCSLLTELGLHQIVNTPTHKLGHILDGFIVRKDSCFTLSKVEDLALSDHFALFGFVRLSFKVHLKKYVTSRNFRSLDLDKFQTDVRKCINECTVNMNVEQLVELYNSILKNTLDEHAPFKTRLLPVRKSAQWRDDHIVNEKRLERKLERKWRETDLTVHRQMYVKQRNVVKRLSRNAMKAQHTLKITNCKTTKQLHLCSDNILGKCKTSPLPTNISKSDLPNTFSTYFTDKIEKIRNEIDLQKSAAPSFTNYSGKRLNQFSAVSEEFVRDLLKSVAPKSCILDPIPTNYVKDMDALIPLITNIINSSLSSGLVPAALKEAVVKPLLKKPNLDVNVLKNYRPVSNLPFISKLLEKVVLQQLQSHLSENNLLEINQSAYRQNHSTETALLHVLDKLLINADRRLVSVLALLDLSAAFDTLDHDIMLKRLHITFGLDGIVLKWFESYLHNRSQTVIIDNEKSDTSNLKYGVPQGSVLGPILFTLYTQPLSELITSHNCDYHKFADDTQLSKGDHIENFSNVMKSIENCIGDITNWMMTNKLKLNPDKTEMLPIAQQSKLSTLESKSALIAGTQIEFTSSARDLGVQVDNTLSMDKHISTVCKSAYFELRRISQMKSYLPLQCIIQLVTCFILSRLDYCNGVLAGLPSNSLHKLQKVQNSAARLVMNKSKREHVTPLLAHLHWLPVRLRIDYKLATFGYKFFDKTLPKYLSDTLYKYEPSRCLRSSTDNKLIQPMRNMKTFGERSFSFQVPKVWNSLPKSIRDSTSLVSFKKQLKTHFYHQAFD